MNGSANWKRQPENEATYLNLQVSGNLSQTNTPCIERESIKTQPSPTKVQLECIKYV